MAKSDAARILYAGDDIRIDDLRTGDRDDLLVISFPVRATHPSFGRVGFGEQWLLKAGIPTIAVRVSSNHWFQTPETDVAMAVIADIAKTFRRVVTYGSSMGAYGAISCSRAVGAHAAIAVSPQISLDSALTPWEKRWRVDYEAVKASFGFMRDNLTSLVSPQTDIYVVADPWGDDARHAGMIKEAVPQSQLLLAHACGHSAAVGLRDYGLLSPFAREMTSAGGNIHRWRKDIRLRRRGYALYWARLARRAVLHRRPELARSAATAALQCSPLSDEAVLEVARALIAIRDLRGAAAALEAVAEPGFGVRILLVDVLRRLGLNEQATINLKFIGLPDHPKVKALTALMAAADVRLS